MSLNAMNFAESSGASSSSGSENGAASSDTDRQYKKARFKWQIKGKHHLKNQADSQTDFPATAAEELRPATPPSELVTPPPKWVRTIMESLQELTFHTVSVHHYLPEINDLNRELEPNPSNSVNDRQRNEERRLSEWQANQIETCSFDNNINQVLESCLSDANLNEDIIRNPDVEAMLNVFIKLYKNIPSNSYDLQTILQGMTIGSPRTGSMIHLSVFGKHISLLAHSIRDDPYNHVPIENLRMFNDQASNELLAVHEHRLNSNELLPGFNASLQ